VKGVVTVFHPLRLQAMISMQCPAPVYCLDLARHSAYVVAGCLGGVVCVHALPPWSTFASSKEVTVLSSIGEAVKGRAVAIGNAALSNIEEARGIAMSAKDLAGEATSIVKGLFSGIFGKKS